MPWVSVTGRSVLGLNVKQATPSAEASSCTPPESVRIAPAPASQRQEVEVALRLDAAHAGGLERVERAGAGEPRARARVDREDDRGTRTRARASAATIRVEALGLVDVRRPVQRRRARRSARARPMRGPRGAVAGAALAAPQRVDHRVADVVDAPGADALGLEVGLALRAVREEQVGELVGEDAVDLLRHAPVARSQARLDVRDRDPHLGGGERAGERRVDVPGDDDRRPAAPRPGPARTSDSTFAVCSPCEARSDAEEAVARQGSRDRRGPRRTGARRSAGRCGRSPGGRRRRRSRAATIGAILTKFGRAPTTCTIVAGPSGPRATGPVHGRRRRGPPRQVAAPAAARNR